MTRKANPTIIGMFIVVGLFLGVGAVLLVSSSKVFTKTSEYILYFDASLTGLDPGTAVKFRGVTIGAVKEVLIHFNQHATDASLPVVIEINEDTLRKRSDETFNLTHEKEFETYVQRGLRGKLEAQSLLTGLMYVNMEFMPGTPATYHQLKPVYREIPTAPLRMQIFQVDFAQTIQKLNSVLGKLEEGLGELQLKELASHLNTLLISVNSVIGSPEITNTVVSARQTLDELRELSKNLRSRLDQLTAAADRTLADSRETLNEVREGVQDLRDALIPQGPLRRELVTTLEELSEAARSVAALADFLQRHPNALLTGKTSESKP